MRKRLRTILLLCLLHNLGFSETTPLITQQAKQARTSLNEALKNYPRTGSDQDKEQYSRELISKYLALNGLLERAKAEVETEINTATSNNSHPLVIEALQDKLDDIKRQLQALPDEIYALTAKKKPQTVSSNASGSNPPASSLPASSTSPSSAPDAENFIENIANSSVSTESNGSADRIVNTPFTRAVVGFDVSGASSADPASKFFGEFFVNAPLGSPFSVLPMFKPGCETCYLRDRDPLESKLWVWLNPRIGTIAQPALLSSFTTPAAFLKPAVSAKPEKIIQSLEFLGGLEYVLMKPRYSFGFGGGDGTTARLGLSAIAGAGAITALSQSQAQSAVFDVTPQLRSLFSIPSSQTHIVFEPKERDRFFRQYYVGLRLRTYFFRPQLKAAKVVQKDSEGNPLTDDSGEPLKLREPDYGKPEILDNRFPGIFDVAFGQNEYVTGGKLGGGVLKIEGFYPFPFAPAFHIFASVDLALKGKAITSNPVLLTPTTNPPGITDPSVFVQPADQPNRDRYRIGVGIDILELIRSRMKGNADLKNKVDDLQSDVNKLKQQDSDKLKHRDASKDPT